MNFDQIIKVNISYVYSSMDTKYISKTHEIHRRCEIVIVFFGRILNWYINSCKKNNGDITIIKIKGTVIIYNPFATIVTKNISSIFSGNSEANASEYPEKHE